MTSEEPVQVVFLRRNIDESFTYLAPSESETSDYLGEPVVVPLGSDLTVGVVIEDQLDVDDTGELKPIKTTIDSLSALPEELIEVGKWVSRYYLAPINSVFRSILPPRFIPEPVNAWKLNEDFTGTAPEDKLLEIISAKESVTLNTLEDGVESGRKKIRKKIDQFRTDDILTETVKFDPAKVNPKKLNYVELVGDSGGQSKDELTTRQRELIDYVRDEGGSYQRDLPDKLRRTRLLNQLEEKEIIIREKRIYRRVPLPSARDEDELERFELTSEQKTVCDRVKKTLDRGTFDVHLVHGVTGSGKTEVYFRLIEEVLENDRTALVLVPEITLASFMVTEFRKRFGMELALLHSGLSQGERLDEWRRIQEGNARVVLGVQSAVFAPLENLGLIVVDEEHDTSYKSGQSPRYHARDVAVVRGRKANAPVVLGSATPSLESYTNSLQGQYKKHEMKERPLGGELPTVRVMDLKGEDSLLTDSFVQTTRDVLRKGHRAIWFYNRRGMSNFILCEECGEVVECQRCNVSLTLHGDPNRLRCHYCGYASDIPDYCSNCGNDTLDSVGSGTQTLASRARELFDNVEVIRMDQDTVGQKGSRFDKLNRFGETSPCLLVGTQMVTKGLDYENVEFVGVVLADTGLQFPDFRSGEKTFQQLVQVCGRAGRKEAGASVHVQTYNPGHYAILHGKNADYESFATKELKNRKPLKYPPFSRLINVVARARRESDVSRVLNRIRQGLPEKDSVQWLGPSPCGIDYVNDQYRWHLMARGHFDIDWKRKLRELVDENSNEVRLMIDVDPIEIH